MNAYSRRDLLKLSLLYPTIRGGLTFKLSYKKDRCLVSLIQGDVGDAAYFMQIVLERMCPGWRTNSDYKHWHKYEPLAGYYLSKDDKSIQEAFIFAVKKSGLKVELIMEKFSVKWSEVEVVAFDLFNTVYRLDRPAEEIKAYARHIHQKNWSPLTLPKEWGELKLFEDAEEGLSLLGELAHTATLTNAPLAIQNELGAAKYFGTVFDLSKYEVYKPAHKAYRSFCKELRVKPERVLMVSANELFGDLEISREVGMQSILLDRQGKYKGECPRTIVELAKFMKRSLS